MVCSVRQTLREIGTDLGAVVFRIERLYTTSNTNSKVDYATLWL